SEKPDDADDLDAGRPIYAGRPRLRALWTEWSVEVRVLSGASKLSCKPAVSAVTRRSATSPVSSTRRGVSGALVAAGDLQEDPCGTAEVLEEFGTVVARGGVGVVIASQSGHRLAALTRRAGRRSREDGRRAAGAVDASSRRVIDERRVAEGPT